MSKGDVRARKEAYFAKIQGLFEEYPKVFLVCADNVGSKQLHQIRAGMRGKAVMLMGKNTMMRRALKAANNPIYDGIISKLVGNVGLVFTKGDLVETRTLITSNRVQAAAKAGVFSQIDVFIDPFNTGMGPEKTQFFQALGIATKITKGTIEILNRQHLIKAGHRVGASDAALLNMLKMSPFSYGLELVHIYENGSVYSPEVLDITKEDIMKIIVSGIASVASLSLALGYPTKASIPHSVVNGFKNLLAIAVETEYEFPQAEKVKAYLADPSAFAVAAPVETAAATETAKAPEPEPEPEESDEDMGFGLFD